MRIKVTGKARLLDALADWGKHEAQGRLRPHLKELRADAFRGPQGRLRAVDVALRYRAPVIARILGSLPRACVRIELRPEHVPLLRVFDGRAADDYAAELLASASESGQHVRRMAKANTPVRGPILATARGAAGRIAPPLTVYEGCHRLAAWIAHGKRGDGYAIAGYLVLTRHDAGLFPRVVTPPGDVAGRRTPNPADSTT
jgi:hypothetical protein